MVELVGTRLEFLDNDEDAVNSMQEELGAVIITQTACRRPKIKQ